MSQLTQEDVRNIIALINTAPIKGVESVVVANLISKLQTMLNSLNNPVNTNEPNGFPQ